MHLSRQTGRARVGSIVPSIGVVSELRAEATAWGQAVLRWNAVYPASRFAVYVDARLHEVTTETEVTLTALSDGPHNLTVIPITDTAAPSTLRPEWQEGDQAVVSWTPIDDPDLAAYLVDGVEVTRVEVPNSTLTPTGIGTGRITTGGRHAGGRVNEPMVLTVAAGNLLEYSVQGLTGAVEIAQNETTQLPFGANVTFLDPPSSYHVGDTYTLPMMIESRLLTDVLDRGMHELEVRGVTMQGVQGDPATVTVFVPAPDASYELKLTYSDDLPQVEWSVSGDHAAGIALYSNLDVDGSLMDSVDEVSPTYRALELGNDVSLPWNGSSGTLKVMVGVATTWGHVVRQLDHYTMTLPPPPAVLGVPEILSATQEGTSIRVRASYTYIDNDETTSIVITRSGLDDHEATVSVLDGEPGNSVEVESVIDGADTDGTLVTVTAAATDGTHTGADSSPMTLTMDLHEPTAPTGLTGVPA